MATITIDRIARHATRTGVEGEAELARFVDVDGDPVYAVLNLPTEPASAGVVICSPFFAEFARNYRREVLLARALADRGIAVARFHHRGVGNSGGDPASVDLDRLAADASAVADAVRSYGVTSLAFHGTRLGAFTAAAAAAQTAGPAPVSTWEPVAEGRRYFNEVFRTRMAQAVHDAETETSAGSLKDTLASGASVDVLGHAVHGAMFASMGEATLVDLLGGSEAADEAAPVLVCQLGRPDAIRKELTRLEGRLAEAGHRVTLAATEGTESWWVANRRADYFRAEENRHLTKDAVGTTTDWLVEVLR